MLSKLVVLFEWNIDVRSICIDPVSIIPESIFANEKLHFPQCCCLPRDFELIYLRPKINPRRNRGNTMWYTGKSKRKWEETCRALPITGISYTLSHQFSRRFVQIYEDGITRECREISILFPRTIYLAVELCVGNDSLGTVYLAANF